VWAFSILLGLLVFWLLGFVVEDLGAWPGPDYAAIESEVLDVKLAQQSSNLSEQLRSANDEISALQERQADLRDSTDSAETTMNRLLAIQRLALEKSRELSERERESLDEAKDLFLSNQKQYQQLNQQIADLKDERRKLKDQHARVEEELDEQRDQAREQYAGRRQWHEVKMAALKLAVLVPLLIIAGLAFARWRGGLYAPLIIASGIATAVKVGLVMHEHFPERYFKYIVIVVALAIVVWVLVRLLQRVARPATDWLLRQYREAYERLVCPVCEHPIRRGPLRFRYWSRRTIAKLSMRIGTAETDEEEPYVCPACATKLYEKCESCGRVRPSLMPACPYCGDQRSPSQIKDLASA
jgi:hypothetical protein